MISDSVSLTTPSSRVHPSSGRCRVGISAATPRVVATPASDPDTQRSGRRLSPYRGSINPVPAHRRPAVGTVAARVEYAAASLNHAPGRHVVVVARHHDTLDAFGARDHEGLSEDFGRVAMPPVFDEEPRSRCARPRPPDGSLHSVRATNESHLSKSLGALHGLRRARIVTHRK